VSVAYNHDGFAVIVHGTLQQARDEEHLALIIELYTAQYGAWWKDWYEGLDHSGDVGGWVEPRKIFARRA
jgi:hypothetical protein